MTSRKPIADDEIWVSKILRDTTRLFRLAEERSEPGWAAWRKSEPIAPEDLPLRVYVETPNQDMRKLRPIIYGGGLA